MNIFDTHAHFPEDPNKTATLLERASAAGVSRLMAVGGSPELNRAALLAASLADGTRPAPSVFLALGMDRDQTSAAGAACPKYDFSAVIDNRTRISAIGEIGLDYYEVFKDGFGKVTLTAVGAENTVFKGWYTGGDNNPTLISTDATYTFEFDKNTYVYAEFEYTATEIWLDGMNMGFDTNGGITEIWLPVQGTYDPNRILVFALINGEPEALTADEYTIDLGGFNGTNPAKGDYVLTFTYKANPELKATHIIRVLDEENLVNFNASSAAGGRVTVDKPYDQYNKGEQVTVTVELRSESDYEFLGWYTVDASGAVGTTCVSTERTYTVTLNETTYLYAKIEPKITRLEVEGLEENPTKIPLAKFEAYENLFAADRGGIYACGALGKVWDDKKGKLVSAGIGDSSFGANGFGNMNFFGALLIEVILTFVFVLVIFAVTDRKMKSAGVFIGAALMFVHILGIPLTGTSVNPARSIGPALFAGGQALQQLWLFIVAPFLGAALSATVWKCLGSDCNCCKKA